ncbi:MAG: hypothetical protein Q4F54_01795 [Coriobacteriia bacterium]|nr:hypothetical protein [Coriobacteriia bacterium]
MSYRGTGEGQGMLNVSPIFVKEFQSDSSDARYATSIIEAEKSHMTEDEK